MTNEIAEQLICSIKSKIVFPDTPLRDNCKVLLRGDDLQKWEISYSAVKAVKAWYYGQLWFHKDHAMLQIHGVEYSTLYLPYSQPDFTGCIAKVISETISEFFSNIK